MPDKRPHLTSFDWFRSLAILLIVAGHSYGLGQIKIDGSWDILISIAIKGATAYFVFISGFMFQYMSVPRFSYGPFLVARIKRVALPFIVLTTTLFLPIWPWGATPVTLIEIYHLYILGDGFQAYWYIPFALLLSACAPLFMVFSKQSPRRQVIIIAALTLIAMLVQRPIDNDNHLQSLVYFAPLFLLGMMVGAHHAWLLAQNWTWPLALAVAGLTVWMLQLGQAQNMHKAFFAYGRPDIGLVQKGLLCLLLVVLLDKMPRLRGVEILAKTSFAVYFLHPFLLALLRGWSWPGWVGVALGASAVVAVCVLIAVLLRRVLGRFSAYMIGY